MRKLVSMLAVLGAAACAGSTAIPPAPPRTPTPYDPAHLLEVELTIDAADFAQLRSEGRDIWKVFSGCVDPTFDYTMVQARARFAGEDFARVGVRKRGFVGSLAWDKPSPRDEERTDRALGARRNRLVCTAARQTGRGHALRLSCAA